MKCGVYNWPWKTAPYPVSRREVVYDQVKIGCVGSGYTGGYAGVAPQGTAPLTDPASAPSTLTALWASASQVQLSWFDMASNATGFAVERRTGKDGTYVPIGTVGAGITRYTDTGLSANATYSYRVRAQNSSGHSDYSLEATARREDFSAGAADFAVQQGTWNTASGPYQVTSSGAGPINASLSLLDIPVSGNFILTADCASVGSSGAWDNFDIVFGYQDEKNFYYVNACESANGAWNGLYKVVDGVTTKLTVWTTPFAPGTVYTMKVQRVGQSILVYRAGALVASVPDTSFPLGKVGFGTSQPTSGPKLAQFANVTLTQSEIRGGQ